MQGQLARFFLNAIFFAMAMVLMASCGGGGGTPATPVTPTSTGTLTVVAGATGGSGYADGVGSEARFYYPQGVAVDSQGNVFVADTSNRVIRKISTSGMVTTFAGSVRPQFTPPTDGFGTAARFVFPLGLAIDANDNLYVADNSAVRKITPAGLVTTFAGSLLETGSLDAVAGNARFSWLSGIVVDAGGTLYVSDRGNQTLRKITADCTVTTLAGTVGMSGYTDGPGTTALFNAPEGLALDSAGNLYVADRDNRAIRKVMLSGVNTGQVSTFIGTSGGLSFPTDILIDNSDNLYVSDLGLVRKITPAAQISTFAGGYPQGYLDASGMAARFFQVSSIDFDSSGNLILADMVNNNVRKISAAGEVTTLAGSAPSRGHVDGATTVARFDTPAGIVASSSGQVFVADTGNSTIRSIVPGTDVSTFAGNAGVQGTTDANGSNASFHTPIYMAGDNAGNLYVLDWFAVRKISATGDVTTLAGQPGTSGMVDGQGSTARFGYSAGIAADANGNVYVTDYSAATVRKITPAGEVSTLAGTAGSHGVIDGTGAVARFGSPGGITLGNDGNLYVVDGLSVRKVTPAGVVTTLSIQTSIEGMQHIAADSTGNLYVSNFLQPVIHKITPTGAVSILAGSQNGETVKIVTGNLPASLNSVNGMAVSGNKLYATDYSENVVISIDLN